MAAISGKVDAVEALVEADRPGIVDSFCAAVCCRRSALVDMRNSVSASLVKPRCYPPPFIVPVTSPWGQVWKIGNKMRRAKKWKEEGNDIGEVK
jgi:hypothetical protein